MGERCVIYDGWEPAREGLREALCTLGNGFFATRGAMPESVADGIHYPGTYVAGCYNRLDSEVAGRTVENEDLVNVPNWLPLSFRIEGGAWFDLDDVELLEHRHELDLRHGLLIRRLLFRDGVGRSTRVIQRRLVSMADPHLAALETTFVPRDWSGRMVVRAGLDGRVSNAGVDRYRGLNGAHLRPIETGNDGDKLCWLQVETVTSRIRIAEAARLRLTGATADGLTCADKDGWTGVELEFDTRQGAPVTVEKTVALFTSMDKAIEESLPAARTAVSRAPGFDDLATAHATAWDRLWSRCRIVVYGDRSDDSPLVSDDPQPTLDLYVFHMLQSLSEHTVDLDVGVPARGLHGEAYRGHVFWDELFVFGFYVVRLPDLARALLLYRWRRLPQARWAATSAGFRGAMFPWQSGSDGREETPHLHLNPRSDRWLPDNSALQRHVGIAVAYNVWRYYQATSDVAFLASYGTEMLLEIARFWASVATYNERFHRYEIRGVMGPDEYHDRYPDAPTPGIDNNSYTNVMAAWTLRRALDALAVLPERRQVELREQLALEQEELDHFAAVAARMRIVFHGENVISQFEGYDRLAELDWTHYRRKYGDIRRLDRILEAEGDDVNRYQVSKQADVLMLFYLLGKDELTQLFTGLGYALAPDAILRTIEYYLARTSHGSTLSAVVHAWVLARSDRRGSWQFFVDALRSDIDADRESTTAEGIHLGAMAGCIELLERCYTGMEFRESTLHLNPRLPSEVVSLDLPVCYRGHVGLTLHCTQQDLRLELPPSHASNIRVAVKAQTVTLRAGQTWAHSLHAAEHGRHRPAMPPG